MTPVALVGTSYNYKSGTGGLFIATCGDTDTIPGAGDCEARFDSAFGGIVGGQLFVGWAVLESLTIGLRGIGAARLPVGFLFVGGPSLPSPYPACGTSDLTSDEELGCVTPPESCR